MIKANTADLEKSLELAAKTITKKLENMVLGFTEEFVETAVANTPLGDSKIFFRYYQRRLTDPSLDSYGLDPTEGFAQGSWQVNFTNSAPFVENYSGTKAVSDARTKIQEYVLGDRFTVLNKGPYIGKLNAGYSPKASGTENTIMHPTIEQVMMAFGINVKKYYTGI